MENQNIEVSQHKAARIVGYMFLFGMAASVFAFVVRGSLFVQGNAAGTAINIMAHERQFRTAIAFDLITAVSVLVLLWAFYVLLKPVNRNLALLGAFLRLMEVAFWCVILVMNFGVLEILNNADLSKTFETRQLQAMSRVIVRIWNDGYTVGFVLLCLGSTVFNFLLFKSNYIPKALAGLGLFSSTLFLVCSFTIIIFPGFTNIVGIYYMGPMAIYEVSLGFLFAIKGAKIHQMKSGN